MIVNDLKNERVGIVFSSGFFGFFAHAGCLKALEEQGIRPVGFAGTSSGAIVAALAAAGLSSDSIREIFFRLKKCDFWDPEPWYKTVLSTLQLFRGSLGYLEGKRFRELLDKHLPLKRFEDLTTPCVIIAANISKKRREIFTTGSIADAVQASGTIPWTFKMKKIGDDYFLDGGLIDKAPVEALRKHVNAHIIIVHYITSQELTESNNSFLLKRISPQKAYRLAMSIERQEHYFAQKMLAEQQGAVVIELRPTLPLVTPNHLQRGREAFTEAYKFTLDYFRDKERG